MLQNLESSGSRRRLSATVSSNMLSRIRFSQKWRFPATIFVIQTWNSNLRVLMDMRL